MHHWERTILRGAGKDLSHAQMRVLLTMGTYASYADGGNIHPGNERLAREIGCNIKTVRESIEVFIERGYMKLTQKGGNEVRKGFANVYQLTYPAWILEESTRVPVSGPLEEQDDPQGDQSVPEGYQSVDGRVPVTGGEGYQSVVPHHSIDHSINNSIHLVTSNPSELPDNVRSFDDIKNSPAYKMTLSWIQKAAENVGTDDYFEAFDQVDGNIEDLFGPDYSEYLQHEWSIPATAKTKYKAGIWLKTFVNTCIKEGLTFYPADSDNDHVLQVG